ncbi:uncharacterized protein LOC121370964 isoform X2 [Gigantopelta aegis]|uniref:uncharacterized protein LOC121370964 isoform X2 n=1 Tax=Gigantopelta aegis TaxID=1735272 RepID=UPI001B889615|nr:uncharacterized protein LOC121370964 isoform X2 [Gigantopelta aegis]
MDYGSGFCVVFLWLMEVVLPISCEAKFSSTVCFGNTYDVHVNVKLQCKLARVIHFVEIVGSQSGHDNCTKTTSVPLCREVIGPVRMDTVVLSPCNGRTHCRQTVARKSFTKCNVASVQVMYDCVSKSAIYDMCTDISVRQNSSTPVIYLKSPGYPYSYGHSHGCKCVAKTRRRSMKSNILHLSFDFLRGESSLVVKNTTATLWDTDEEKRTCKFSSCLFASLIQQNRNVTQSQSYIQISYDNNNYTGQNVWMEIVGDPNELMTLTCSGGKTKADEDIVLPGLRANETETEIREMMETEQKELEGNLSSSSNGSSSLPAYVLKPNPAGRNDNSDSTTPLSHCQHFYTQGFAEANQMTGCSSWN